MEILIIILFKSFYFSVCFPEHQRSKHVKHYVFHLFCNCETLSPTLREDHKL
jgi:hypothetical protein